MNDTLKPSSRMEVVDALRGFAVLAILIVHSQEHFMYFVFPDASLQPEWLNYINTLSHDVIFALFAGKSYSIFALLFGLTFYIQQRSQEKKGYDFGYRFLWRIFWLMGFAVINALVFPGGDVLMLYVVVAMVLFITSKWSTRATLILSIIFLLQLIEWIFYFIDKDITAQVNGPMWGEIKNYTQYGTFGEFLIGNLWYGQKASLLWAVENGRISQTAGLFLLGMLAGRTQRFANSEKNINFWRNILIIGTMLYVVFFTIKGVTEYSYAVLALDMWVKLAFTFVIISSFVLSYWQVEKFRQICTPLRSYGRASLSNYLGQSYLGALLFFPFGLNLAPVCGMAVSLLIGVGMFIVQVTFCNIWFKHYDKGPLEWIWHKLTWVNFKKA